MKFLKNLFSQNSEKNYQVKMYYGTKLKWLPINSEFYTEKDSERMSFYLKRIHPQNIFKSDFGI
mgnify:FL=1